MWASSPTLERATVTDEPPFTPATRLVCAACGGSPWEDDPFPFRCPNAGSGDVDHVLVRHLDPTRIRFVAEAHPGWANVESHPFVRHRELLHAWHRARTGGMDDWTFQAIVDVVSSMLPGETRAHRQTPTPFGRWPDLAARLGIEQGEVWVKDETGNPSGSHKIRHLFGLALHLEVSERLELVTRGEIDRRGLAIASCGNAALAAAMVAAAIRHPLTAFIPEDADPRVVSSLRSLDTRTVVCPRPPGVPGDPCMRAFRRAVAGGQIPFCVQGSDNGLAVEGGHTIAWEMAECVARDGGRLDRVFVQVGGGALASATAAGLAEARALGFPAGVPRIHAVQTHAAQPLRRAYERVRDRALVRLGEPPAPAGEEAAVATRLAFPDAAAAVREAMAHARAHRGRYMWPWETMPHSIAHGILDDETYDWAAVVEAMLSSGGWPVTVGEDTLAEARGLAVETTGIPVDPTGAAGLAGLVELRRAGAVRPDEHVAVLFTGVDRAAAATGETGR